MVNKHKQEREQFYRQLFALIKELPTRDANGNRTYVKTYDLTQAYNARYSDYVHEPAMAAGLNHLAKHGMLEKRSHYEGTRWYLVASASIDWLYTQHEGQSVQRS